MLAHDRRMKFFRKVAAASLAIPIILKQSTRFEVISNSTTWSRSPMASPHCGHLFEIYPSPVLRDTYLCLFPVLPRNISCQRTALPEAFLFFDLPPLPGFWPGCRPLSPAKTTGTKSPSETFFAPVTSGHFPSRHPPDKRSFVSASGCFFYGKNFSSRSFSRFLSLFSIPHIDFERSSIHIFPVSQSRSGTYALIQEIGVFILYSPSKSKYIHCFAARKIKTGSKISYRFHTAGAYRQSHTSGAPHVPDRFRMQILNKLPGRSRKPAEHSGAPYRIRESRSIRCPCTYGILSLRTHASDVHFRTRLCEWEVMRTEFHLLSPVRKLCGNC